MEIFWPLHSDYITSVLCWCKKRKIWACTKNEATLQSKKRMCVWDTVSNSKKARRCEMHYWINADRFVFLNNYRLLAESMYAQLNQIIMHLHASTHFYYNVVQFLPNATLFCISLFAVLHNIARLVSVSLSHQEDFQRNNPMQWHLNKLKWTLSFDLPESNTIWFDVRQTKKLNAVYMPVIEKLTPSDMNEQKRW